MLLRPELVQPCAHPSWSFLAMFATITITSTIGLIAIMERAGIVPPPPPPPAPAIRVHLADCGPGQALFMPSDGSPASCQTVVIDGMWGTWTIDR